jgi:hypothetical protein
MDPQHWEKGEKTKDKGEIEMKRGKINVTGQK